MRQKFEDLRGNLEEFVLQTDYSMLLVSCRPEDCPYIASFLDGQDAAHPASFFLVWPGEFVDMASYVSALVALLDARLAEAAPIRAERGLAAFPPIGPELRDERLDPLSRFRSWLGFLVSLLDDARAQSFVVGLLPSACSRPAEYARLLQSVLPVPQREAWLEPLRIVGFDHKDDSQLFPILEQLGAETVLTWEADFSSAALTDALAREAANPSAAPDARMAALLQLAGVDFAHQRHDDAQRKFAIAYEHYAAQQQRAMQAVCLHGAGESLAATGDLVQAKRFHQRGVALCMKENAYGVILTLIQSLIRICTALGQHTEAESYAQSGSQLAAAMLNPALYAHLDELKGDAQRAQRRREDAIVTYAHARKLSEAYELFTVWKSSLEKLAQLHTEAGRSDSARAMERERQRVEALERGKASAAQPVGKSA